MISWVYIFVAESNTMYIKFSNFSWMNESHEIHENLNPMKINTHTVAPWGTPAEKNKVQNPQK